MALSISVITPSFNQGRFIERTIKSVLTQDIGDFEYWVIDGGSKDKTVDILKQYETKLNWLSEADKGQTNAINKGLARTNGDIICWLNSDDIYYPEAIGTIREFFEQNPDVDIVYGDAYHIDQDDQIIERYYTQPWDVEKLKTLCYLCQPAVFFRRDVIKKFGYLDESLNYCMDYEYWLRLALGGARFGYLQKILSGSRLHSETKTVGSRLKVSEEINDMLKKKIRKVPNSWLYNYVQAVVRENTAFNWASPRSMMKITIYILMASYRWNRAINFSMLMIASRWLASGMFKAIKNKIIK